MRRRFLGNLQPLFPVGEFLLAVPAVVVTVSLLLCEGHSLNPLGRCPRERIDALAALERHNDFTVESRDTLSFADYFDVIENVDAAKGVLDALRNLTDTERETVLRALDAGYYETPREATVTDLAEEFDVSTTGISKNIRRGERKLLCALADARADIEE